MRLIDADALIAEYDRVHVGAPGGARKLMVAAHTVDAVPVVRCRDCKHAETLERNCELSKGCYMHCNLWRGDETRNVWHKYKKYYRDYSIVELDGYCSDGERRSGDAER
jgi:hypothetical protein